MSGVYPQLKPHDPDGTRLRTIKVVLETGDGLLPATTLEAVYPVAPLAGETFAVELVSMGFIESAAGADIWGVNFKLHGGLNIDGMYYIRLRPVLASQPEEPAYDQTFRVRVEQT